MARKKRHEEHENHERWLVSYADFITLLFAFFTVLYATSQGDLKKQEEFEESIKKEFAQFRIMGSGGPQGGGAGATIGNADPFSGDSAIQPSIEVFPRPGSGTAEIRDYVDRRVEQNLKDQDKETVTGVRHDSVGVRIQLAASRLFLSGSADLIPESASALHELGQMLKDSGRRIIIEGHTDDEPIRTERYPSNWELSAARATKIVRYLAARHKIPASKLTAVAYADQKPVVPNDTPENRSRNRRIEIMIVTTGAQAL